MPFYQLVCYRVCKGASLFKLHHNIFRQARTDEEAAAMTLVNFQET